MTKLKADDVVALLAKRHAKDVFVAQCKTGSTWHRRCPILDAWAMPRSWSNDWSAGYEVKVSRSDFLRDDKWKHYLDYCSRFFFVCPHGLIQLEELPDDVGLIYVSKNGAKLYTKRKAPDRPVDQLHQLDIFRYILITRSRITESNFGSVSVESSRDYWRRWMLKRDVDRDFGHRVSRAIRERVDREITRVRRENEGLRAKHETYDHIEAMLSDLGLDPAAVGRWDIKRAIDTAVGRHSPEIIRYLDRLDAAVADLRASLDRVIPKEPTRGGESS